jgi:hypothetical protein
MNEDLKYTFNNINEWLKFAEAKNAGLLALNAACIIGILQSESAFSNDIIFFKGILLTLFCISSCLCLYSILPVLNKWFRFYKKLDTNEFNAQKSNLNALYFGDISKLSAEQYIELFEFKHNLQLTNPEKDFGNQITNNAEISWQKYRIFTCAVWLSYIAFLVAISLIIIKSLT